MANEYKNAYFYSGSGKTSLDITINGETYIFSGTAAEGTFPAIDADGTTLITGKTNYVVENTTVTGLTKQVEGSNVAIVKSKIENNVLNGTSSGYYGIINTNVTTIISESAFNGNDNTKYRAIVYQDAGTLLIDKTSFSKNNVGAWGTLARSGTGTASVTNSSFTENTGKSGAAIYTHEKANGSYTVKNTTFTKNVATVSGGAIYIHAATGYDNAFDISHCTFTKNVATGSGGAIYTGRDAIIENNYFYRNYANQGGAIYLTNNTGSELKKLYFEGNTANYGGAIYAGTSTVTFSGLTFNGNTATADGTGGAISTDEYCDITLNGVELLTESDSIRNNGKITFKGTNIINARLWNRGSAQAFVNDATMIFGNTAAVTHSNLTFNENGDNHLVFTNSATVTFSSQDFSNVKSITVTGNLAGEFASGITAINENADIVMGTTVKLGETAVAADLHSLGVVSYAAGKLSYAGGTMTLAASASGNFTLDKFISGYQGHVEITGGKHTIAGEKFTDNVICNGNGGAIYINKNCDVAISDTVFSGNTADTDNKKSGGAIYINKNNNVTLTNVYFENNHAGYGGAIYVYSSTVSFSGLTFRNNVGTANSDGRGGAVATDANSDVTLTDVQLLTAGDSIRNNGKITFKGTNIINALLCNHTPATGSFHMDNATFIFNNDEEIYISSINSFTGENALVFNGKKVAFKTDLSVEDVAITVDGSGRQAGDIIATGVTGLLDADDIVANNSDVYLAIDESGNLVLKANTEISGVTTNGTAFFGRAEGDGSGISVTVDKADTTYGATVRAGSASGTDSVIKSTVTAGTFNNNLYGGGLVSAAKTDITVSGTTEVKQILYGGIFVKDQTTATDLGESNLTVAGGVFNHNVVGGSRVDVNENALNVTHTTDKVNLTISGGNFAKKGTSTDPGVAVYSAGYVNGIGEKEPASTGYDYKVNENTVVINGGVEIKGAVYGGVFACQGGKAYVGSVSISVENAKVDRVLGGGWAQTGGKSDVGTVKITLENGAEVGVVYAGGGNAKVGNTEVFGKVDETIQNVTITVNGGDVGEIFMGGRYNKSVVTGAVVVTINSEADSTISRISGKNGYGVRLENAGSTELVVNSILNVGMLDSVDKLTIAEGKTLNITDSFSYDGELAINFDLGEDKVFDGESEWTVMTGVTLDDIANVKFAINGTEITGIADGVLGESGYKFEYGNKTLKFTKLA